MTDAPSALMTDAPSALMTDAPSARMTDAPSALMTDAPSALMTDAPSALMTEAPSARADINERCGRTHEGHKQAVTPDLVMKLISISLASWLLGLLLDRKST